MKKTKVLIIGSGGHAKSCIDVIENSKKFNIVGLIDNDKKKMIGKYKVIFSDNEILKIKKTSKNLVLGLGSLDNINKRVQVFKKFKKLGFNFPKIISKYALVSKNSKIGEGTILFNHVFVNAGSEIGKNCIINNKSLIEHDTLVGNHSHISTNVVVNGNCVIGEKTFIGSGSVLKNNIIIKKNSFIKMGTIQKKNR